MGLKTYDPKQVVLTIGTHAVSGYMDGTFINAARNEDAFTISVGADGETTRVKSNNKTGRVTLTLKQSSDSNDILSAIAAADELGNAGIVPILLKDLKGRTLGTAARAWVVKVPEIVYSKGVEGRAWIFESDEFLPFVGGNSQ